MKTGSSPCGADVLTVGPGTDLFVVRPDLFTVGPDNSGCFSAATGPRAIVFGPHLSS